MRIFDVAIIGGGAAGLMAAVKASQNKDVVIIEGNKKLGKKLLATGNGRCNLTNNNMSREHYHGDSKLIEPLLLRYGTDEILKEFRSMGLLTTADSEGRVYPQNLQAAAVLKALSDTCSERGVECFTEFTVFSAVKSGESFIIKAEDAREIRAKKLILATGGLASPNHSCEGQGMSIVKQLGHSLTKMHPALAGLCTSDKFIKPLSGMRSRARVALTGNGKLIAAREGEIIFSDKAVSGICIFDLSIPAAEFLEQDSKGDLSLEIDLCPHMRQEEIKEFLLETCSNRPSMVAGDMLMGVINMKIGLELVRSCGIDTMAPISSVKDKDLTALCRRVKALKIKVDGVKGFKDAQITAGGVPLNEVETLTMESKKCKGLYLVGELLNIHGDCGGYNLHWAWLTGLAAGSSNANNTIIL